MAEMIAAWPTLVSIDRLTLPGSTDARLRDAALEVERRVRPPGDPRHFASTIDNHADIFPTEFQGELDLLWDRVSAGLREHLRQAYRVTAAHNLAWTLSVLLARPGDRLSAHSHPQRDLFAAYYPHIDPPVGEASTAGGELRFIDNRGWGRKWLNRNPSLFDSAYLTLPPEPGVLVIAPGYAWHETTPFFGNGLRVTYGFFINVQMNREYA